MIDFIIKSQKPISQKFLSLNINRFKDATNYIRNLNYARVSSYTDVLIKNKGT